MMTIDVESAGLDPTIDFLSVVGLMGDFGISCISSPAKQFRDDPLKAEYNLLKRMTEMNYNYNEPILTFNGAHFDLGFLKTRLMVHELPEPPFIHTPHHIDLMSFATACNGGVRISKDNAARKYCNNYVPSSSSGAYLAKIYSQRIVTDDQHFGTLMHNCQDLRVTRQMFDAWNDWPLFEQHFVAQFPDFRTWCPKTISKEVVL